MADPRSLDYTRHLAHAAAHADRRAANPGSIGDAVRPADAAGHA